MPPILPGCAPAGDEIPAVQPATRRMVVNPYKYLPALQNGQGYRYIKDPETVSKWKWVATQLKKGHDFMAIAVDAYKNDQYEMRKNNVSAIKQGVCERYSKFESYQDIQKDFCTFLDGNQETIYAIPGQWGPPSKETHLMKSQLCGIMSNGFLTWDSQPGIYLEDDDEEYIQVPYLFLSGPSDAVQALLQYLDNVVFDGKKVVQLVDVEEYERAKKNHGYEGSKGEGLKPTHYVEELGVKKIGLALAQHDLVMLSSPPELWHLPFFTIIYNAAFGVVLDQQTISINLHLP
jgi:hypothetical protein